MVAGGANVDRISRYQLHRHRCPRNLECLQGNLSDQYGDRHRCSGHLHEQKTIRVVLCHDMPDDWLVRSHNFRLAISKRDHLKPEPSMEPDYRKCCIFAQHAQINDNNHVNFPAHRVTLPGLDLLDLPQPGIWRTKEPNLLMLLEINPVGIHDLSSFG